MAVAWKAGYVAAMLVPALGSCSSGGPTPGLTANEPVVSQLPGGHLTAVQISNALKGWTFSYEAGKGQGTGLWQSSDGKLCEARNPMGFLPKGTPSSRSPFTANGSVYAAGATQLTPS